MKFVVRATPFLVVVQCALIVIGLLAVTPRISLFYPNQTSKLALVAAACLLCSLLILLINLLIWANRHGETIQTRWLAFRSHLRLPRKSPKVVPVAQLSQLREQIYQLDLAFHGMTLELEQARRLRFQMLGESLPPLVLPVRNALLFAEHTGMVKMLTMLGFPNHLEQVNLAPREVEFFLQWAKDLEMRLKQNEERYQVLQHTTRLAMSSMRRFQQSIGEQYPGAVADEGFRRIQGALTLLEKIWQDEHSSDALVQNCAFKLRQDLEILAKRWSNA